MTDNEMAAEVRAWRSLSNNLNATIEKMHIAEAASRTKLYGLTGATQRQHAIIIDLDAQVARLKESNGILESSDKNQKDQIAELTKKLSGYGEGYDAMANQVRLLESDLEMKSIDLALAKSSLKGYRDATKSLGIGYGEPENKEPETEVGYLRRELAYAQGQLHQSHLAVKEIARRINLHADPRDPSYVKPEQEPVKLIDADRDAIWALMAEVREIKANLVNNRDLEAAGIIKHTNADVRKAIKEWSASGRGIKDNHGHGDNSELTA